MTTMSIQDRIALSIERMNKEDHEKFKRETLELIRKKRETKEQKNKGDRIKEAEERSKETE